MSNLENKESNTILTEDELAFDLFNEQLTKEAMKEGLLPSDEKPPEVQELNDVEKEQSDKGWKPKADFISAGGAEDDWIPAKQFKRVGEIISAKQQAAKSASAANSEVKELTKTVQSLIDKHRKAELKLQEDRLEELRQIKIQKIQEGDTQAVFAAEAEADQLLKAKAEVTITPPPAAIEDPKVKEWEAKNTWLREDSTDPKEQRTRKLMRALVGDIAQNYMKTNPNIDPLIALADIDRQLQEEFPQKFEREVPVSKVSVSDSSPAKAKPTLFNKLNDDQQQMFRQMSKIPGSYTLDEYVDLLQKAGEL